MPDLLSLDDVRAAARRLDRVAHRTPVLTSAALDDRVGAHVFVKHEGMQRAGAFKFRGAYHTLATLLERRPSLSDKGVCTVSSGNHAQALALAGRLLAVPVAVLMPADAPAAKRAATEGYGAEVVTYDRASVPQKEAGARFAEERDLLLVSSHDDPLISAGAGTAALELWEDAGPFDVLVAPVGGGGGITGYATVAKAVSDGRCRVVAAEPAASGVHAASRAAGERVSIPVPETIADGQQLTIPGAYPFLVMQERVDDIVSVDDAALIGAMAFLFDRMKAVAEPSGAMATAAVLSGIAPVEPGQRVGVILSGSNVGRARFAQLMSAVL